MKSGTCSCPSTYGYPTIAGCFDSCINPIYQRCSTPSSTLSTPTYCVLLKNGKFLNATYQCQGCMSNDGVAVGTGACTCANIVCPFGTTCSYGNCVNNTYMTQKCNPSLPCVIWYSCINGICVGKLCTSPCQLGLVR